MSNNIIEVNNVSMKYNLSKEKVDNIKEYIIKMFKRQLFYDEFWALRDIDFSIKKGESLGVVGLNGSGKSTLLKLIAGVLKPTKGNIKVGGTIAPLIELGAGFDMELSARENIFLNGAILGYSKKEMLKQLDDIIEFSELPEFLEVPVKNFSSGMLARLAFAISTSGHYDILIADEILSVGDYKFQEKCMDRMRKMINDGITIILVSHSIEQIEKNCEKTLWLNKGQTVMFGNTKDVCLKYKQL
jgi:O-antigen export system ATP-binding protein rfbB